MHRDSQGRAVFSFTRFIIECAFAKASLPCSPVMENVLLGTNEMKNIVNFICISVFFIGPFVYAWHYPDQTAAAVAISFLIGVLLIADWYHIHLMKNYKNCLLWLIGCGILSAFIFMIFFQLYGYNPFMNPDMISSSGLSRFLFRILITLLGIACISIVNLPRIGVLKILKIETKPESSKDSQGIRVLKNLG